MKSLFFVFAILFATVFAIGSISDYARGIIHNAQLQNASITACGNDDNPPLVRMDTRKQIEAYLAVCH